MPDQSHVLLHLRGLRGCSGLTATLFMSARDRLRTQGCNPRGSCVRSIAGFGASRFFVLTGLFYRSRVVFLHSTLSKAVHIFVQSTFEHVLHFSPAQRPHTSFVSHTLNFEHRVEGFVCPCRRPSSFLFLFTSREIVVGSLSNLQAISAQVRVRLNSSCNSFLSSCVKWLYGMVFLLILPVKTGVGGKTMLPDTPCRGMVSTARAKRPSHSTPAHL